MDEDRKGKFFEALKKGTLVYLLFSSLLIMIFIFGGSHGKFMLNNPDTQKGTIAIIILGITAVINFFSQKIFAKKSTRYLIAILNLIAISIIIYLATSLFYPDIFSFVSSFFFSIQIVGILCGLITIYLIISNKVPRHGRADPSGYIN